MSHLHSSLDEAQVRPMLSHPQVGTPLASLTQLFSRTSGPRDNPHPAPLTAAAMGLCVCAVQ